MGTRAIDLNEAAALMINIVREEFETWRQTLPESVVSKLEELPRPAAAGRAVRVTVQTPAWEAEATVWESGEADLASSAAAVAACRCATAQQQGREGSGDGNSWESWSLSAVNGLKPV